MSTPPTAPLSVRKLMNNILFSKGRMEALTDGIFAIAMTLLVLELKVPDLPKSADTHELLHKIGEEMPAIFSFIVSFLYCALLWTMHHMAMHFIRHLQMGLVWLNLLFLMSISVMPFSCGLLGHFVRNKAAEEIYFCNMFVAAGLIAVQWLVAKKRNLLNEDDFKASTLMGHRILFLPLAICGGMIGAYFSLNTGFYTMAFILLALRIWQRKWYDRQTANSQTVNL
jgi:uncharacterized membrane protein